jgi:RNA polymerase sigma factor (sigma-70 family)
MMTTKLMPVTANNDAELVVETLTGDRDAFSQIVARYQSLICSLTYSATGNLGQSEDLAQETFITAWKHIGQLRERHKLRAWLCGIARNRINNFLRSEGREPSHRAESLEEISESHSSEPLPAEQTISNEEQAILWRSLEKIPEIYREPLVLFYREHQSIAAVARNLELSEDAVKQRLSRGRKLLQEQVLAFVEGALEKTSPGKAFTLGVIAALPLVTTTAKAATVGAAVAKGGAAAKSVATAGTLGGLFTILGGGISAYISLRAKADDTKSPRERQFMLQMIGVRFVSCLFLIMMYIGLGQLVFSQTHFAHDILTAALVFFTYVTGMWLFVHGSRRQQQIQIEDKTFVQAEWTTPRKETDSMANPPGTKSNTNATAARFMAFLVVLTVIMIFQTPWKEHLDRAILWSSALLLALVWSFLKWQKLPRYQSLRSSWVVVSPILMGLMTLCVFNLHQYQAQAGTDAASSASPEETFVFNLVVVSAYAAFVGIILAWKRKESFPVNAVEIDAR